MGTANLYGLQLAAADAHAAMRRINRLARAAKHKDDPRTMDQLRADVFFDLLHGRNHEKNGRDRAVVDITIDLSALAGLDENPGLIPGWGPVISDIAPQVTEHHHDAEWRATVTGNDGRSSGRGPPAADPPTPNDVRSKPRVRPVFSPDAEYPPPNAISTIIRPGQTADPPNPGTPDRSAATTMSANTTDGT
jgi:hypothetical protein